MNTVTLGVSSLHQVKARTAAALRGEPQGTYLSFASIDLLWRTMTPRRWEIIRFMTGKAPLSLRAVARGVSRDPKTTHGDVHALLAAGLLEKTSDGKVLLPYDAVHVDFTITRAA